MCTTRLHLLQSLAFRTPTKSFYKNKATMCHKFTDCTSFSRVQKLWEAWSLHHPPPVSQQIGSSARYFYLATWAILQAGSWNSSGESNESNHLQSIPAFFLFDSPRPPNHLQTGTLLEVRCGMLRLYEVIVRSLRLAGR